MQNEIKAAVDSLRGVQDSEAAYKTLMDAAELADEDIASCVAERATELVTSYAKACEQERNRLFLAAYIDTSSDS